MVSYVNRYGTKGSNILPVADRDTELVSIGYHPQPKFWRPRDPNPAFCWQNSVCNYCAKLINSSNLHHCQIYWASHHPQKWWERDDPLILENVEEKGIVETAVELGLVL